MLLWLAMIACTPAPEQVLAADTARTGADGSLGPHGVVHVAARVQGRVTEAVPVDLFVPGEPGAPSVQDAPTAVYVHGGLVAPDRYHWQAVHWASRGYVVVMPRSDWLLAITQPGNGAVALDTLIELVDAHDLAGAAAEDGPFAVGGHSLGGVVSAMHWADDDRVAGLMLFASYPAASTDVAARAGSPVLALSGTADGLSTPDDVTSALAPFEEPLFFGFVDGMNHFAWTDDPSPGELARDGEATRPVADLRRDADRVTDTWLDAWLRDDPVAHAALDAGQFPGVEVQ